MKKVLTVLLAAFLYGCASNQPAPGPLFSTPIEPMDNMAIVYIYRGSAFAGSIRDVNVFINGEPKFVLGNGTYIATHLKPGEYEFGIKNVPGWQYEEGPYIHLSSTIVAGKSYYVGYFKSFDVAGTPEQEYFHQSSKQEINTGLLEGGVLDIDHLLGIVKEDYALSDIKKSKLSRLVVDLEKI